jgi:DDE superfamily endonuclease
MIRKLHAIREQRYHFKQFRDIMDEYDEWEDDADEFLDLTIHYYESHRYLQKRRYHKSSSSMFQKSLPSNRYAHPEANGAASDDTNDSHPWLSEDDFRRKFRMCKKSFFEIIELIKDHKVFHRTNPQGRKQAPIAYQLMVLLKFLGTEGSGSCNADIRETFHCGYGTCEKYRQRVVTAICSLYPMAVTWPNQEERREIAHHIHSEYGFRNCIGFIDGTLFPLAFEPQVQHAPCYSGRKFAYSLSSIIICDHQRLIRHYTSGHPGCSHDNRIFKSSDLYQYPRDYLSDREYLLGDSAFESSWFMVSAYKCLPRQVLTPEQEMFNGALARPRIISEHCNGILKGRFCFLRSIRMVINENPSSVQKILMYIDVCIILHNLLTQRNDDIPPEEYACDDLSEIDGHASDHELDLAVPHGAPNDERRTQVHHYLDEVYEPRYQPLN